MNQFVEITSRKPGSMCIRFLDPSMLDLSFFSRSPKTDWTLSCLVSDAEKGELLYSTEQLIPLSNFLEETVFTRKEAYQFLSSLLEKLIFTSRSHALLLDLEGIYVSAMGDEFWFAPLPVLPSCRPLFQAQTTLCLQRLSQAMQMPGIYEIFGYLFCSLSDQAISLPEVLCGLQDLESQFVHKSFLERFKPAKGYRRKEPATARYASRSPQISDPVLERDRQLETMEKRKEQKTEGFVFRKTEASSSSFFRNDLLQKEAVMPDPIPAPVQESAVLAPGMKTEVIGSAPASCSCLEIDGIRHELQFETTEIGRHVSCTIHLEDPSVSLHHARITCDQGRCYITSLGSTNGTFLNEKKVIRKMRLRQGMVLRFGNTQAVFHE